MPPCQCRRSCWIRAPKHSECFFTGRDDFPAPTNNHRINVTIFPSAPTTSDATSSGMMIETSDAGIGEAFSQAASQIEGGAMSETL